jgi:hypothetical protein
MGSERANEDILYNMGAKNTKKYGPINDQIIMAGESILMMNLCTENQILSNSVVQYITKMATESKLMMNCRLCTENQILSNNMVQYMTKMATESKLMMNCRLCTEKYLTKIKVRRSEWAGHMNNDRIKKKVFLRKPDGRRKIGRPKLRWLDY